MILIGIKCWRKVLILNSDQGLYLIRPFLISLISLSALEETSLNKIS